MNKNKITKFVGGVMAGLILAQSAAIAVNECNINQTIEEINICNNQFKDPTIIIPDCDIRYEGYKEGHPLFDMGKEVAAKADEYIEAGKIQDAIRMVQDLRYCVPFFANQGHRALLPYIKGIENLNYLSKPNPEETIEVPALPIQPDLTKEMTFTTKVYNKKMEYYKAILQEDWVAASTKWIELNTLHVCTISELDRMGFSRADAENLYNVSIKHAADDFKKQLLFSHVGARQKLLYSCCWNSNQAEIVDFLTSEMATELLKIQAVHHALNAAQFVAAFIPYIGSAIEFALIAADRAAVMAMARQSTTIKTLANMAVDADEAVTQNRIDYIRHNARYLIQGLAHLEKHYLSDVLNAINEDNDLTANGKVVLQRVLSVDMPWGDYSELFVVLSKVSSRLAALTQTSSTLQKESWDKTYNYSSLPEKSMWKLFLNLKENTEVYYLTDKYEGAMKAYNQLIDVNKISWNNRRMITKDTILQYIMWPNK